jgi:hypothetical protein
VKYDLQKIQELERFNEEYGLEEPEKYNLLKSIHDGVLARRAALPQVKPSEIVGYVLGQKAAIGNEPIPVRVVPITEQARKTVER